jgi:glycosyltransferase involved in cell wall biosynthesis
MHIVLFLSGLAGGGAQRRMITLARGFAARGCRVDLVAARGDGPFRDQVPASVRVIGLDNPWQRLPVLGTMRGLWVPASTWALAGYLRRERPDILISTSTPANLTAIWARLRSRLEVPLVVSVNVHLSASVRGRSGAYGWLLRRLLRQAYARADGVIAISRGVARDVAGFAGVPEERIATIYNPVDVPFIQSQAGKAAAAPGPEASGVPLVLGVGKLKRQKDFGTLIKAFARVRRVRPARLVILGEGEERCALLRLARRLGVPGDVSLPGFVANPHAWMARASVFVLSSAWEGFSNALVEALAVGCPAVSTDCPSGPREVLDHGTYGPLVPVGDDETLAAAILQTLDAPPERAFLQARAAAFSVDASVEGYLDVLRRLCSQMAGGPAPVAPIGPPPSPMEAR